MTLAVVTATTNYERARPCLQSWGSTPKIIVLNGPLHEAQQDRHINDTILERSEYLGTVPAFRAGVDYALDSTKAEIIACLHDDVQILDPEWQAKVIRHFERHPACGLLGFSGAIGLGAEDMYQKPYDPMSLARVGFRSNLVDAEVHGLRSLLPEQVACNDGFSLIGRREFFDGFPEPTYRARELDAIASERVGAVGVYCGPRADRPYTYFADHGIIHHAFDSLMGAYAKRLGWEVWYLPISARHFGGQTAVGDAGYSRWAAEQIPGGDQGFWEQSHKVGYQLFKDQLPIRL